MSYNKYVTRHEIYVEHDIVLNLISLSRVWSMGNIKKLKLFKYNKIKWEYSVICILFKNKITKEISAKLIK